MNVGHGWIKDLGPFDVKRFIASIASPPKEVWRREFTSRVMSSWDGDIDHAICRSGAQQTAAVSPKRAKERHAKGPRQRSGSLRSPVFAYATRNGILAVLVHCKRSLCPKTCSNNSPHPPSRKLPYDPRLRSRTYVYRMPI